jgi:uncharacterized protein (DUF1778 family)
MPTRRHRPLPRLDISLEDLPPPESKRTCRLHPSFTPAELAMIEKAAEERDEQPSAFCRTLILTAFQNSAVRTLTEKPHVVEMSPLELQRALLEIFSLEPESKARVPPPPPPEPKRTSRLHLSFTPSELAMIEAAAQERGEQASTFCRTVILTAFQNSAARASTKPPELSEMSPTEIQRVLLKIFSS